MNTKLLTRSLMSGNEAVCQGALDAGVAVGVGYPGTPSSEILEYLSKFDNVYTEWSVNEKVALEIGIGSAFGGVRTLVTMKHVGLNVAADPLFAVSYTGVNAGLVIVSADDPHMYSSQNEQDNRNYGIFAKIPVLEPSDFQEARDFTREAFYLSEKYDTPVILRMVTRLCHSKGIVRGKNFIRQPVQCKSFTAKPEKYILAPNYARRRHAIIEKRLKVMEEEFYSLSINKIELRDRHIGIITAGNCYNYVKEVFGEFSICKLGTIHPLPMKLIREFCHAVEKVYVVEELDPVLENQIKAKGIKVTGKALLPVTGELNQDILQYKMCDLYGDKKDYPVVDREIYELPERPPVLCPGCPHRNLFKIISREDVFIAGDIGCYTLGAFAPYYAMDTVLEMGASIGIAQGMQQTSNTKDKKNIAIIGDSTFAHSGITGLLNAAYNQSDILVIVLDNSITAMTGMQPNPFSGERLNGKITHKVNYIKLGEAFGIENKNIRIVNAFREKEVEETYRYLSNVQGLALMVVQGRCIIHGKRKRRNN